MGQLVDGRWHPREAGGSETGGRFVRQESQFRDWVSDDGSTPYAAEADRYHLYVSLACPWAHRTLIFRRLKGLEEVIGLSVVDPLMADSGWEFSEAEGAIPDYVNGFRYLHQLYSAARSDVTTRATVPVLWDKERRTIVNNESAEIIRMLNRSFDAFGVASVDLYPEELRNEIDEINAVVYDHVNNGVYKCGFARSQQAYDEAFANLFRVLDQLEARLSERRYLVGPRLTEADWRLFTTLVRFDAVYVGHFKCNRRRIADYPNLQGYLQELYQIPGIAETVDMGHIKGHYYRSHTSINPSQIVAGGPELDLRSEHDRYRLPAQEIGIRPASGATSETRRPGS